MVYNMENAEEVMQILERYTRLKQKEIPKELDEYLQYVAKTGDTVFKWANLKYLFREKLLNVIKNFHDASSTRGDEIPQYPNVDPFNYESMKSALLERLELFNAAPFTIQRLCELLIDPHKQYSRIDKFMRALEKNILVSTLEPGRKRTESENGDSLDSVVNGDLSLDVNVDIDMENDTLFNSETQNGHAIIRCDTRYPSEKANPDTSCWPRSADEDIMPNPKKLKLDLNEKEKPADGALTVEHAASKSESKTDSKTEAGTEDDEQNNDVEKVVEDLPPKDMDNDTEMLENKEESKAEVEKTADTKVAEKHESEKQETEKEKLDDEKSTNDDMEKKIVEEVKEVEVIAKVEVDIKKQDDSKDEIETENKLAVEEEKIIEKQEIEKGEKEEHLTVEATSTTDIATSTDSIEVQKSADKIVEKQATDSTDANEIVVEKPVTENTEIATTEKIEEIAANVENVDASKSAEKSTCDEVKEIENETVSATEELKVTESMEKKTEAKEEKIEIDSTESVDVDTTTSKAVTAEITTSETPTIVEEANAVTSSADAPTVEMPAAETVTGEALPAETPAAAETPTADATSAKLPSADEPNAEVSTTDELNAEVATVEAPTDNIPTADAQTTETLTPIVVPTSTVVLAESNTPAEQLTVAETITNDKVQTIASSIIAENPIVNTATNVIIPPTLALNDQPMDETSVDDMTSVVDEVVMTETAETEMATDAAEPSKDEPAHMEVDETSQEAMDQ